jgi:hypothetical protein
MQFVDLIDAVVLDDGLGPANSSSITVTLSTTLTIALGSLSSAVDGAFFGPLGY